MVATSEFSKLPVAGDDPEAGTVLIYPGPTREIPSFIITPKMRGAFVRVDASDKVRPLVPVFKEYEDLVGSGYLFEPAYEGRRFLINTGTRKVYNRSGARLVAFGRNETHAMLLDRLCDAVQEEPNWMEVVFPLIRIEVENELVRAGFNYLNCLIVLDVMQPDTTYLTRRAWLSARFDQLGIRQRPESGDVFLAPAFHISMATKLAAAVALQNKEWHARLYSGIISKPLSAYYPMQCDDAYRQVTFAREFFPICGLDGFHESKS